MATTNLPTLNQVETIRRRFEFLGNVNGVKVKKYNSQGDGDIHTGDGGKVYTTVTASLAQISKSVVRLTLKYHVWESSWESGKSKADRLWFQATQDYNLADFSKTYSYKDPDDKNATITEIVTCELDPSCKGEAYYKAWYGTKDSRHGWLRVLNSDYPDQNRPQSWLVTGSDKSKEKNDGLFVKIDDNGSELTKEGNIGVYGYVNFKLKVKRVRTRFVPDTAITSQVGMPASKGGQPILAQIPAVVRSVLGRGYRIEGDYASSTFLMDPVIDIDKINEYKRLEYDDQEAYDGDSFQGNGSKEYKSSFASSLEMKVSGGGWGATFSSETKKTFSEERSGKDEYKLYTIKDVYRYGLYRVQGAGRPVDLCGFLTDEFRKDLDRLTGYDLVCKYGTYVVLGMQIGGRLFYNMSYKRSLHSISTVRSFSTSNSFSYSASIINKQDTAERPKDYYEELIKKGLDGTLKDDKMVKALKEIIEARSTSQKSQSGSTSGPNPKVPGISASASYSEDASSSEIEEMASTEIRCTGVGGDIRLLKQIEQDPSQFNPWVNSVTPENSKWCDFVPGTLVAIYELVPSGYKLSANDVKQGWERYLIEKSKPSPIPLGKGNIAESLVMQGKNSAHNYGKDVLKNGCDGEICTQSGKLTEYRVRLELVNIGTTVGINVQYLVAEGGFGANRSQIMYFETYQLSQGSNNRIAIDPSVPAVCEFQGKFVGKEHGWIDVTELAAAQHCPWLVTTNANVYVKIDGTGDNDYGNIGVKFSVNVPILKYA